MYQHDESPDQPPAQLDQVLDEIMHADLASAKAAEAANQPTSHRGRTIALSMVIAVGAFGMVFPPAWLLPAPDAVPLRRATVRNVATELMEQADGVVWHYRNRGGLPASVTAEDDGSAPGQYLMLGGTSFELRAAAGDVTVVLPVTIPTVGDPVYAVTTVPVGAP